MTEFIPREHCRRPLECEAAKYCVHNCRLYGLGNTLFSPPDGVEEPAETVMQVARGITEHARSYKGLTPDSLSLADCTVPKEIVVMSFAVVDDVVKLKVTIRFRFRSVADCPIYYVYGYGNRAKEGWSACMANIKKNVHKVDKFAISR